MQSEGTAWLIDSLRYIDITGEILLREGIRIAKATFGAFGIKELMEMSVTDYNIVIDELKDKNHGEGHSSDSGT